MKIAARNQLTAEVIEIKKGAVMAEVKVRIAAGAVMASVMTLESLDDMEIKEGDKVKLIAKAVNMLLIKE